MSTHLEALAPTLLAMSPDDVDEPRLPMATVLQEANDLYDFTQ